MQYILLFIAAFIAGAINSVAGGGTLITFPSLLSAGVSPIAANTTSTVALVPGSFSAYWGYRDELEHGWKELAWIGLPSLIGGYLGAVLLVHTGDKLFAKMIPWLILGATALFAIQEPFRRIVNRNASGDPSHHAFKGRRLALTMAYQFVVALYGGFFGAGIGILMLAALGMLGLSNIHRMNALKAFAAVCINGVAAVTFIIERNVVWHFAILMAVGSVAGGYGGAGLARRIGQRNVRLSVIVIGVAIGLYTLLKRS
ncbi:MAG: sulfite exporter TauE/SafE family protein [Armatimonadetes bacterium]|nr:sulfite exporter TauE/SafE family protein [Armatimonadota bacterium]